MNFISSKGYGIGCLIVSTIALWPVPLVYAEEAVVVQATGQAPADLPRAKEASVEAALRRAVEAGAGVELTAASQTKNFELVSDVIYAKTAGYVRSYKILTENPNQEGLYTVRVEAQVLKGSLDADLMAFKTLLQRKGYPRFMVMGQANRQPFDRQTVAEIQSQLDRRQISLVDGSALVSGIVSAKLGASEKTDVGQAAAAASKAGADYLLFVDANVTENPPEVILGIQTISADASVAIQVVKADNSQILASEVFHGQVRADTKDKASRQALSKALQGAVAMALERVAVHWLGDFDQRGAGEIQLELRHANAEQVTDLAAELGRTPGIKQVIVASVSNRGVSLMRVFSNSASVDIAHIIEGIAPAFSMEEFSGSRIVMTAAHGGSGREILAVLAGIAGALVVMAFGFMLTRRASKVRKD